MKQSLLALAGTGILAIGLIAGSLAVTGGIPGVQAMSFMHSIPMLHNAHGAMHGDSAHHDMARHDMDCPYMDETPGGMMSRGNLHQMMNDDMKCPFSDRMPDNAMSMGMHGDNGHHARQMMDSDRECPLVAKHTKQ